MKNLKQHMLESLRIGICDEVKVPAYESLRIGINDKPESDWNNINCLYRISITNYELYVDIHNVDPKLIEIEDTRISFPDYTPNNKSFKSMFCDTKITGDYDIIDDGILYNEYYDKGLIFIVFHPDMKEYFYNLVDNISKWGDSIATDDICKLIDIPEVNKYIKEIRGIGNKLVVETPNYIIDAIKKFQKTDI